MPNIKTIRSNIVMTKALWSIVVSFTSGTNAIGQTTTENRPGWAERERYSYSFRYKYGLIRLNKNPSKFEGRRTSNSRFSGRELPSHAPPEPDLSKRLALPERP